MHRTPLAYTAMTLLTIMSVLFVSATRLLGQDLEVTLVERARAFDRPLPLGKSFTVNGTAVCKDPVPSAVRLDTWAVSDALARELEAHIERSRSNGYRDRWNNIYDLHQPISPLTVGGAGADTTGGASADTTGTDSPSGDNAARADSVRAQRRLDMIDTDILASVSQYNMLVDAGHLGFARRIATYVDQPSTGGEFEIDHSPLDFETNYVFVLWRSTNKRFVFDKRQTQCDAPVLLVVREKSSPPLTTHFGVVYLPYKSTATIVAGIDISLIRTEEPWESSNRTLVQQGLSLTMGLPIASVSGAPAADDKQQTDSQDPWWQNLIFTLSVPFFDGIVDGGVGVVFDDVDQHNGDEDIKPRFLFGIGFDVDVFGYLWTKLSDVELTQP